MNIARTISVGLVASLSLAALLIAGTASAETTERKAKVCIKFEVLKSASGRPLGVCRDGKRPVIFTNWLPVTINDGERDHTYTVGF